MTPEEKQLLEDIWYIASTYRQDREDNNFGDAAESYHRLKNAIDKYEEWRFYGDKQ